MHIFSEQVAMTLGLYPDELLEQRQLIKLTQHKYSSSGSTLLDPCMQVFWNWFVQKIPISIAPNSLTITGLIINVVTTVILIYYSPDGRQEIPAWALLLFALGLFVYQTLDAVDGKQARRTGSSSPLGELFDHGCDSLSTVFVALATCVSVKLGSYPNVMFYQFMAASTLFYTAHWQTYVSGTLLFGKFDVTEAQVTIIIMHIISAIFGVSIWSSQVPIVNLPLNMFTVCFCLGGAVITILNLLYKISDGGIGKNGSSVADTSILSPAGPLSIMLATSIMIYLKSPTNLYENNPCLYLLTFGLAIAKITNRLVVAQMTRHEVKTLDTVMIGPFVLILNQYFNIPINEYYVLWFALMFTIFDVLWFACKVCHEIRDHLHINIFSITPRPPKPEPGPPNGSTRGRPGKGSRRKDNR